jgi:phosphoglycerate dehydrogenase-like enzyme
MEVVMPELPEVLNVLAITRMRPEVVERIEAVAPGRVKVHAVWDDFQPELAEEWPEAVMKRRGGGDAPPTRSREQLEELIRSAHAAILSVPWPLDAPNRMPNLIWTHMPFAGVTNLKESAWWNPKTLVTSARGSTSAIPIAESAIGGAFMLARRLDIAVRQTDAREMDATPYRPFMKVLNGKTMGIVGLGGIGGEVARMARGIGMRVIATRHSAKERQADVDGVDVMFPPSELHDMLSECDFVAVCAMWTPETERMLNKAAFDAVKPGAFFLNVARGEIVDEPAMVEALKSGQLAGAYIDVWQGDTTEPPIPELLEAPNIIITPHVSPGADGDYNRGVDIFCENLGRLLRGEELLNRVDFERGY